MTTPMGIQQGAFSLLIIALSVAVIVVPVAAVVYVVRKS